MHELSVTKSIVSACAERAGTRKVQAVHLRIGRFSGVEPHAVRFCFELCVAGTTLEGAELVIEEVAGKGRCKGCGEQLALELPIALCPCERRESVELVAGEELLIEAMEI